MSFLGKLTKLFNQPDIKEFKKKKKRKEIVRHKIAKPIVAPAVSKKFIAQARARAINEAKAQASAQAKEIVLEARDEALKIRNNASEEVRRIQDKVRKTQDEMGRKIGALEEKEKFLSVQDKQLKEKFVDIEKVKKQQLLKLERAAGLTTQEAKKLILEATEKKLTSEIGRLIKEADEKAKQEADEKAREILIEAMHRGAIDYVPEYTVSAVKLPDEDMKGRIIGREGRNIRTFEKMTGVDVDLDEEGIIRLSSFDSIRREVAKVSLEKLITDGRIQPSRIEEIVEATKKDIDRVILKAGEELCHKVKVYNLPLEVVKVLGRFKYRFSYGQNMIAHTWEETKIGLHLAHQVGANVNVVRLGCLLHDIGKVITEEEGSHVQIGTEFLRKHNVPGPVIDCVAQHHEDEPFTSKEAILVYIADAISGSRPGARYEDYEEYVERLTKLEKVAKSFKGVENAYAIQAGREVRVIVSPKDITDAGAIKLAKDIKDKVQKELTYPGQVKVNVIRELRATEVAK
ncbi:ribonuclease Y [Patescibacteria group bacterium]